MAAAFLYAVLMYFAIYFANVTIAETKPSWKSFLSFAILVIGIFFAYILTIPSQMQFDSYQVHVEPGYKVKSLWALKRTCVLMPIFLLPGMLASCLTLYLKKKNISAKIRIVLIYFIIPIFFPLIVLALYFAFR